jgi:hypothetical protein
VDAWDQDGSDDMTIEILNIAVEVETDGDG